ncbi:MAG: hypothetical protein E6767_13965 [Dysgonomonas sp.]|nr:hypothetical protein [Dysgonomonas sp.]
MKLKTDIYTKIVLTVIAIALVGILIKDIDFVTKAQASEPGLSVAKIEKSKNNNEDVTFFVYENDELVGGFGKEKYTEYTFNTSNPSLKSKGYSSDSKYEKAYINKYYDTPKYIITTKKDSFLLER